MPRQQGTALQLLVVQEAARWGWLVPDWDDPQTAGDWAVWGNTYRTCDMNLTKWCPVNSEGKRWPEWAAKAFVEATDSYWTEMSSEGTITHVFTDNTWPGPNFYIGETNGYVDFRRMGVNENTQANTPLGRKIRKSYRNGHVRFQELFQQEILEHGGKPLLWHMNCAVTSGDDKFPGRYPGDAFFGRASKILREHQNGDIVTASGFAAEITAVRNAARGLMNCRRGVMNHLGMGSAVTFNVAELTFFLAFYAMTFDDDRDAGMVHMSGDGPTEDIALMMVDPKPAILDIVWGTPVENRPTAPGGGGNGTNNNGSAIWHREFTNVILAANPGASTQSFYPPIGVWKDNAGGGAIGVGGVSMPAVTGRLLVRV